MTDDLRTRIAAVIYDADAELWDWLEEMECATTRFDLADVLIRELGWRRQVDDKATFRMEPSRHRYVTDWTVGE